MKLNNIYLFIIMTAFMLTSCEDEITVDNGFEESQIVVDAWISNSDGPQTIAITESQNYFDNRLPTKVSGAIVSVKNGDQTLDFIENAEGDYVWTPTSALPNVGNVGDEFTLTIEVDGQLITSTTKLNRVPEIDSIRIYYEEEAFGADPGLFSELYATDLPGQGDTYWVRSYRNDTLLNRPQELNLIYDATFDSGTNIDGTTFIRPLRFGINALDDDGFPKELFSGDRVKSEIHSISNEAFRFLQLVQEQTTNGDNSIFALPVANSRGNVYDSNGDRVLGVFNVAAISSLEVTVP